MAANGSAEPRSREGGEGEPKGADGWTGAASPSPRSGVLQPLGSGVAASAAGFPTLTGAILPPKGLPPSFFPPPLPL